MTTVTRLAAVDGWHNYKDATVVSYPTVDTSVPTKFGFNLFSSYDGYTQGAAESTTTLLARLNADYGGFDWCKVFYPDFLPTTWSAGTQGEAHVNNPANHVILTFNWVHGSIASGSHDAAITTYVQSIPAGKHVILCENEIDNHIGNNTNTAEWALYVSDMNHLFDLLESLTLAAQVEVWDCFMEYTLEPSTPANRQWQDFMTNPLKRHGYVWDNYWNLATVDKTGNTQVGYITAKMAALGHTRYVIGELGDRRQEDVNTPAANIGQNGHFASDSARATMMSTRIDALLNANPAPEGVCWFDLVGSSGDHRVITFTSGGPDVLMKAMLAGRYATALAA